MKALTSSLSLVAICAIAAPAAADVTAAELWADWQANAAEAGLPLSAQATENGGGLILSQMTWDVPEVEGEPAVQVAFGDIELTNQSDGSVSIRLAQPFEITIAANEGGDSLGGVVMELATEGFDFTATGDMSDLTYALNSASMVLSLVELEDFKGPQPEVTLDMTIADFAGMFRYFDMSEDRGMETSVSTGPANFQMEVLGPPDEPGRVAANFTMGPSQATSSGTNMTLYQNIMLTADPTTPVGNGPLPSLNSESTYESISYDFDVDVPDTQFNMVGSNGGGHIDSGFGPDGVVMDIGAQDMVLAVRSSDLPVPVDVTAASTRVALSFPAVAEPEPSDFSMILDYQDVAISDGLWSMVDPSGAVPRDPITLQLDISGLAQMFTDMVSLDPTTLAGPPGELRSLSLNTLNVAAGGATLTGSGSAEFQPGAFPPMPVGSVDLGLDGLNGLLDALTTAGLLPVEQAGMARAMVGMFARPGAGPDTLETTIDFLPGGGIAANGVPLQ